MILMELLFALTVPSEPRPKKSACVVSGFSSVKEGSNSRERCVRSSMIPMVKGFLGSGLFNSLKMALTIAGSNSLDESPYLPPMIRPSY